MKHLFLAIFIVVTWKGMNASLETIVHQKIVNNAVDKLLYIIDTTGIKNSNVVLAQMILETNYFNSKIFKENHNGFGMKFNSRGYANATLNGHAAYPSIIESIQDYRDWQLKTFKWKGGTDEEYLYFLDNLPGKRRYAEDPKYTIKLKKIIKLIKRAKRSKT